MMQPNGPFPGIAGVILLLIWLALMAGMIVAWIVLLIAVWRGMKAHESIAASLQDLATHVKGGPPAAGP